MTNIEMSFDVEQDDIQPNIIDVIIQELAQFENLTVSVTGFQPSCELFRSISFYCLFMLLKCMIDYDTVVN